MMVLIDYFNVLTTGRLSAIPKGGHWRQYFIASFLGATPGCLGAFMNVSFYTHGILSFGAIAAGMISTSGDEAFVMLAMFPDKAMILFGVLFLIAIGSGWVLDKIANLSKMRLCQECQLQQVHTSDIEQCYCFRPKNIGPQLRSISPPRLLILLLLALFFILIIAGVIGPNVWNWQKIILVILLPIATFITITVPDHYIKEHISGSYKRSSKNTLWGSMNLFFSPQYLHSPIFPLPMIQQCAPLGELRQRHRPVLIYLSKFNILCITVYLSPVQSCASITKSKPFIT